MKVTAIIPAYNEENRIEKVIGPILNTKIISNIVVVDDGSEDSTSEIVSKYNVHLIKMPINRGKAAAVKEGIKYCKDKSDIIILLDADLIGLTPKHIEELVFPVQKEDFHMSIGIFKSGRYLTDLAQVVAPNLSGQRAMRIDVASEILNLDIEGYGIEIAFSKIIKKHNLKVKSVVLENLTHTTKEEKIGFFKGAIWRMQMYKDILKHWIH